MKHIDIHLIVLLAWVSVASAQLCISVSFPRERGVSFDGWLLVMLSKDSTREPRFQINDGPTTQQAFGVTVDGWKAEQPTLVDSKTFDYPRKSLSDIPRGAYWVQALLHKYETFHRSDEYVVKLPMDRGEGQQWNRAPVNLYSTPRKILIDPTATATVKIVLDQEIPPIEPPKDTKYIKHVKIQSERLSKFWGRDMYLGANVLLPHGWEEHPHARYPLAIFHGHFLSTFTGFREEPPDLTLSPDYSERFRIHGYNRIQQEYAYKLYKDWTSLNSCASS